ncbi:MAG: T9SS type A sorting domain-containing protein [Candidatus Fermentibacteraceae bacterium]|nr:T9SS type A sorting domain-containing protein [Candidatus Fermentibacteraceae bacterium]
MNSLGVSDETSAAVTSFNLQVFPCPSSSVTISYDLPAYDRVRIDIYDLSGRRLDTITDSFQHSGSGSIIWNRSSDTGSRVENGVYFCRLESGGITETKQIILI